MRCLFRPLAVLAGAFALVLTAGCASESSDASDGASAAVSTTSIDDVAGAFTVDYGLGILASDRLHDLPSDALFDELPDGDARAFARCLAARHDVVKGDTLSGSTWDYQGQRYYVLITALEDGNGLTNLHMLFVFSSDGVSRFSVLAWDGKKNLKISYKKGTPCTADAAAP